MEHLKGNKKALESITALRRLLANGVIDGEEYTSIRKKIMDKYGQYLSPIRATLG